MPWWPVFSDAQSVVGLRLFDLIRWVRKIERGLGGPSQPERHASHCYAAGAAKRGLEAQASARLIGTRSCAACQSELSISWTRAVTIATSFSLTAEPKRYPIPVLTFWMVNNGCAHCWLVLPSLPMRSVVCGSILALPTQDNVRAFGSLQRHNRSVTTLTQGTGFGQTSDGERERASSQIRIINRLGSTMASSYEGLMTKNSLTAKLLRMVSNSLSRHCHMVQHPTRPSNFTIFLTRGSDAHRATLKLGLMRSVLLQAKRRCERH